jgi:hypothetical protein
LASSVIVPAETLKVTDIEEQLNEPAAMLPGSTWPPGSRAEPEPIGPNTWPATLSRRTETPPALFATRNWIHPDQDCPVLALEPVKYPA